ncbi:MAG: diiron oxygenase [Gammaproteobacteria bacterium]|nr:diiron oxygenase [Gammaproteobacteria bacterium]NIR58162.1 diiron oxygenase [Gammaproteobacteria bacterium]NIR88157.1 diiron oxygenase [Gammaproteobacteria bacterium]
MQKSRKSIESLARLNRQASERAFDIEDIEWSLSIDRTKEWIPEALSLLSFAPSYRLLDDQERRRCNQLSALGTCEQFVLFEQAVLRALPAVTRQCVLPAELRESLRCFAVEEEKHIQMFWRLLERSEPRFYPARRPMLASVSGLQGFTMNCALKHPQLFLAWIWLTIFLEERTLFVSREYMRAQREKPESIDPLHAQVHAFHFKDEVRHCQIDQHLLSVLYDPQPLWKKTLAGGMFARVLRIFVFPGRTARRSLEVLGREYPRLRARMIPNLLTELADIGRNPDFHRRLFGRSALPRTLELLSQYPEHAPAWRLLPAARSASSRTSARPCVAVIGDRR